MKKEKKNLMTILSLVSIIISLVGFVIDTEMVVLVLGLSLAFAVVGIIFGFIGKKQIKSSNEKGNGLAVAGIIIGFAIVVFSSAGLFGYLAMKDINFNDMAICKMDNHVKDCIDNKDGTSTCNYMDSQDILCSTEQLKESQFKK